MTSEQLLAIYPQLTFHDDPAEIQEANTHAYATDPDGEFDVVFDAGKTADTVFIYRDSPLLAGFDFSATRAELLAKFGDPAASGPDQDLKFLGPQGAWDRFDFQSYSLHFQYVYKSDQLRMVTLMTPEVVRRVTSQ